MIIKTKLKMKGLIRQIQKIKIIRNKLLIKTPLLNKIRKNLLFKILKTFSKTKNYLLFQMKRIWNKMRTLELRESLKRLKMINRLLRFKAKEIKLLSGNKIKIKKLKKMDKVI